MQDAIALVGEARTAVEAVRDFDPALAGIADRLAEAGYLISDVATELAAYAESVEADPGRLAAVQERRAVLSPRHPQVRRGHRRGARLGRAGRRSGSPSSTATTSASAS